MADEHQNGEGNAQSGDELKNGQKEPARETRSDKPEPPLSWRPSQIESADKASRTEGPSGSEPNPRFRKISLNQMEQELLVSARKQISISQICAIVSIFIGGVLLSSIALAFAILGFTKLNKIANSKEGDPSAKSAIKRPGIMAMVLCVFALTVNLVAMIYMYPVVVEAMQSGDFSSLFTFGQGGAGTATGSTSTWG